MEFKECKNNVQGLWQSKIVGRFYCQYAEEEHGQYYPVLSTADFVIPARREMLPGGCVLLEFPTVTQSKLPSDFG